MTSFKIKPHSGGDDLINPSDLMRGFQNSQLGTSPRTPSSSKLFTLCLLFWRHLVDRFHDFIFRLRRLSPNRRVSQRVNIFYKNQYEMLTSSTCQESSVGSFPFIKHHKCQKSKVLPYEESTCSLNIYSPWFSQLGHPSFLDQRGVTLVSFLPKIINLRNQVSPCEERNYGQKNIYSSWLSPLGHPSCLKEK